MTSRSYLLGAVLLLAGGVRAQDRPLGSCGFDGFGGEIHLAEVTAKSAAAFFGCATAGDCQPAKVKAGDLVVVYSTHGDWVCGYLSQRDGAGPGWILARDLRAVSADPAPPPAAWSGIWRQDANRLEIRPGKSAGTLAVEGSAVWRGRGVEHTGHVAGEGPPSGNRLHLSEGGADACTLDFTLIGPYLVADDNDRCGGMNVRFWGIWKRAAK